MTGMNDEVASAAIDADSVGARAADWVQRRNFWHWTEADQAELDAWLNQTIGNRIAYWRLAATFERTERLVALRPFATETTTVAERKWIRPSVIGFAAALVAVVVLGSAAFLFLQDSRESTYTTAVGEHETISLADGSQIELNTDTTVRVSASAHRRVVSLEKGEAYFQVKHDVARSFIVLAGGRRLTDIGTKFLVRRDDDHLAVAVMEGRIKLDTPDSATQSPPAMLASGDTVLATANSLSVTKKSTQSLIDELGWRRGLLVFQHTTLADAAREFNRYNAEKLVVVDGKTAALQINGTFRANDVEAFTGAAKEVFGLRVESRGFEIVISR